ncbi:MAG: NADH-quinone oxidoreductase subunit NuoB [Verrucomicrobia bacterium]|nr:NADH-quinone oxidoreductase subunit NuoB [Verrucomicrobiota bacterium]
MFDLLRKSLATGIVTSDYPDAPPAVAPNSRGRPVIDYHHWKDARPAAAVCPTGAIACTETTTERTVTLDLGRCIFCGLCAEADPVIRMTPACELATRHRAHLRQTARYRLRPDGTHGELIAGPPSSPPQPPPDATGQQLRDRIHQVLGRSLHIREVDAGSCNGCEIEVVALNNPVYDLERFGIHFVASPRHADLLLVTGTVTRNLELALRKTYEAMPTPRLVVAVGACGCSGGIFGRNYASLGGVDQVLPVDVYIPGCPPNPHALLHGILVAIGRLQPHSASPTTGSGPEV